MRRKTVRTLLAASIAATVAVSSERGYQAREDAVVERWKQISESESGDLYEAYAKTGAMPDTAILEKLRERRFRHLVRAAALDLHETGQLGTSRARQLSQVLVTEAYRQNVPLPLLIGIMRVENPPFLSRAISFVGAKGLMQIMPNVWLPVFGDKFGRDLGDDRTNIMFGAAILRENLKSAQGDWRAALLRYNGCRRGTNTPTCHKYPGMVHEAIRKDAKWVCRNLTVEECIGGGEPQIADAPESRKNTQYTADLKQ